MSESRRREREWHFYVNDMIACCERVLAYTATLEQAEFVADRRTYDAALYNVLLIGEAAANLPESVRSEHRDVPWRALVGARNRIVHGHFAVDDDVIWSIIQDAIPLLLPQLRGIIDKAE